MRRELTLLERIAEYGKGPGAATAEEDVEALMESVRRQLVKLLNARQGMSEAQPDYGLPAMSDLIVGRGEHVRKMQEAIQATIEKYEPRLRGVRVAAIVGETSRQTVAFRVEGVLIGRSGEHRVWYETSISGNGQFDVSA